MTFHEILQLLRMKERESGYLLENALALSRYREKSNFQILRPSDAFYLPAVNSKAPTKWATVLSRRFSNFGVADEDDGPHVPTSGHDCRQADVTTHQPQQINVKRIKRKLQLDQEACRTSG